MQTSQLSSRGKKYRLTSGGIPSAAAGEEVKAGASDGFFGVRGRKAEGHCHCEICVQYCYSGSKRYVLHILYGINPGPTPLVNISTFAAIGEIGEIWYV